MRLFKQGTYHRTKDQKRNSRSGSKTEEIIASDQDSTYAIKVIGLKKNYGEKEVLKGIDLTVNKGDIFGLLGGNGVGKTTMLECIEGLRTYEDGKIILHGSIAIQLQSSSLPEGIRTREAIELFCGWNHCSTDQELLKELDINYFDKTSYQNMSTGQKRKLHLALALLAKPDILFLDEPTAGLDVEARVTLHRKLRQLNTEGTTILLASHDMAEVEQLCDKVAVLKDGILAFDGTPSQMREKLNIAQQIYLKLASELPKVSLINSRFLKMEEEYYVYEGKDLSSALFELLTIVSENKCQVIDLKIQTATLEDCFLSMVKEEIV